MKHTWMVFSTELEKQFRTESFFWAVILSFIILMTTTVYIGENETEYNIITTYLQMEQGVIEPYYMLSGAAVAKTCCGSSALLYMMITAGLAFLFVRKAEVDNGTDKLVIHRSGIVRYHICRWAAALVSGGCIVALAALLYIGCAFLLYPPLASYHEDASMLAIRGLGNVPLCIFQTLVGMFLHGAVCAGWIYLIAWLMRQEYIVMAFGLLLAYELDIANGKLSQDLWDRGQETMAEWIEKINMSCISKSALTQFGFPVAFFVSMLFQLSLGVFFIWRMYRRTQHAESSFR